MNNRTGTARTITTYGAPVLHRPCKPIDTFDSELHDLIEDMFASMYKAEGVGLAANQIGVDARVFVYDCPDSSGEHQIGHVINPVLRPAALAVHEASDDEGCLSVPGQHAVMTRPALATVSGVDKFGEPLTVSGTGMLARCLQHETDHLNGIVYVDRLPTEQRAQILTAAGLPVPR